MNTLLAGPAGEDHNVSTASELTMNILLLNAGSSSLKCTLFRSEEETVIATGLADWSGSSTRYQFTGPNGARSDEVSWKGCGQAVPRFVADLFDGSEASCQRSSLAAVGHRIVHGGEFTSTVMIRPEIRARISALADLAPLHNPPSLEAFAAAEAALPGIPQVAVFDTSFHATLPPAAYTYPLPQSWTRDWGLRRYGFHGLSHAYCTGRAAEMLGRPAVDLRIVVCHLGHGCSASAVQAGKCVDTTMGFTPLEGLMMATRSGSIDPGLLLHIQQRHGLSAETVDSKLNRESGLLGVSGISADMRQVLAAAKGGHQQARLAIGIYVHRVRQAIGALAVTMGGIDALVFTAGVGEHASEIRASVCVGLECLGLELDSAINESYQPDADIASKNSRGRILVIATREDIIMLREVIQVLGAKPT